MINNKPKFYIKDKNLVIRKDGSVGIFVDSNILQNVILYNDFCIDLKNYSNNFEHCKSNISSIYKMFDILAIFKIKDCDNLSSNNKSLIQSELQDFLYSKNIFDVNDVSKNFPNIKAVWNSSCKEFLKKCPNKSCIYFKEDNCGRDNMRFCILMGECYKISKKEQL